ncbi:MAG: PepSY domain-containing protein [Gammaproteobacteria bacterium]
MLKKKLVFLIAGIFMILFAQGILAEELPTKSLTMSSVIQKLQSKGYNIIRKVKIEDGNYKAETINSQGIEVKVRINSQTGEISSSNEKPVKLTMLDAVKKVEAAGYHDIYKVESEDGTYEVKAFGKDGKKAELKVNANTGDVSKEWF